MIKPRARSAEETKARIIESAQELFSLKGYANVGLREIAVRSDVSVALVMKYFSTKANLFRLALTEALISPEFFQGDRAKFGRFLVNTVTDPDLEVIQPAMIALSIGDEEAKGIIAEVSEKFVVEPMAAWIGTSDARARANFLLMLTLGYVIFTRHIAPKFSWDCTDETADLVANSLQAALDESP
jgi:AcrR family transcriptional regulator